ncbi:hypothetical protein Goklo_002933, partial [Gossypium klotzschianum]|nr:hypothetical protein [Gossypium klotzschianum]
MSKNGVCLNTDGSVRHDDGFFAVRGIVRDHDGKWLFGFNRYLRIDLGYDNVIIQSDCLEAVKDIQEGFVEGFNSAP